MNKRILMIAIVALMSIILAVSVSALSSVRIIFDGEELESDVDPVIEDGRTMVPLRVIAEKFGANVSWDGKNNEVIIDTNDIKTVNDEDLSEYKENINFENGFYRPDTDKLPEDIQNWINYSKKVPAVQEKQYDGYRFVLVTDGTKPTGGYDVEVEEVIEKDEQLELKINSTEPGEDEVVTQAITYPYDLIILEDNALPLDFVDTEDPDRYFESLIGIDKIDRPIVAESEYIKVFEPAPDKEIDENFTLSGIANVFEGTVNYDIVTDDGEVVYDDFTTAVMGDWGYFEEEIQLPDVEDDELTLQLYSTSMKDGSKMFLVEIPLFVSN